jgi:SAM-dependent methyltransferase
VTRAPDGSEAWPGWEDAAVPPERLGAYLQENIFEPLGMRDTAFKLRPDMKFLDVGCGAFRAGVHLVEYLDPGNYYGIDANLSVMEAGYAHELGRKRRRKLPLTNLRATDRFNVDFGVEFDMAIAQSVFTHMSLNFVRLCLHRVAEVMKTGSVFFVTFNEAPEDVPRDGVLNASKRPRFSERNVYWYYSSDIEWAASFSPWEYRYIGDWGHPRGQQMAALIRQ